MKINLIIGLIICLLPCSVLANDDIFSARDISLLAYEQETLMMNGAECNSLHKDFVDIAGINCIDGLNNIVTSRKSDEILEISEIAMGVILRTLWGLVHKNSALIHRNVPVSQAQATSVAPRVTRIQFNLETDFSAVRLRWALHF